jgi:hypothetical protein
MIIGLTGHTNGFGPYIKKHFENNGHTVIGFSRSNGYDIKSTKSVDKMLDHKFDVMINNAVDVNGQSEVLSRCCNRQRQVVSIGSRITCIRSECISEQYRVEYTAKVMLLNTYRTLQWGHYISWGYHISSITEDFPELEDRTTITDAMQQLYDICCIR